MRLYEPCYWNAMLWGKVVAKEERLVSAAATAVRVDLVRFAPAVTPKRRDRPRRNALRPARAPRLFRQDSAPYRPGARSVSEF